MSASHRLKIGVVTAGLSCLLLGFAVAQQDQPSQSPSNREIAPGAAGQTDRAIDPQADRSSAQRRTAGYRGTEATAGAANKVVDHFLANCLLAKNEGEVALSQIAQQKAQNPDVKQFAEKMIEDHGKLIAKLQPLAGGANRKADGAYGTRKETDRTSVRSSEATPGSPGAGQTIPSTRTTAETTVGVGATDRPAAGGAIHQLMQIERQISERCLQAAKQELQQKSGAEFDKCYVANAIGAHMHALAALEVIGQQTQGQLAQVAQEAQPTVQQHLDHAKQLMKQLEAKAGASATQAERPTSTRTE